MNNCKNSSTVGGQVKPHDNGNFHYLSSSSDNTEKEITNSKFSNTLNQSSGLKKIILGIAIGSFLTILLYDENTMNSISERFSVHRLKYLSIGREDREVPDIIITTPENNETEEANTTGTPNLLLETNKPDENFDDAFDYNNYQQGLRDKVFEETKQPPNRIDWLHVPKTGTSFLYSILHYTCDRSIVRKSRDQEKVALERIANMVIKGGERSPCQRGLRFYHSPLKQDPNIGHSGYKTEQVVSMFRHPLRRLASGFVNKYHDCNKAVIHKNQNAAYYCNILSEENPKEKELEQVHDIIKNYAKCVEGCQTRMVSGIGGCGHYNEKSTNSYRTPNTLFTVNQVLKMAKEKLDKFAFVGIQENWVESSCMWRRDFQRKSGRDYLVEYTTFNNRPSHRKTCEDKIVEYLESTGWNDPLDEKFYDMAYHIYEKNLGKCRNAKDPALNVKTKYSMPYADRRKRNNRN